MTTPPSLAELVTHPEPELVFAVVSPVGCDLELFQGLFEGIVRQYGYDTNVLRLSDLVQKLHTEHVGVIVNTAGEYNRINSFMTAGNKLRELARRADVLALYAIAEIRKGRHVGGDKRTAPLAKRVHFLRSLKHPQEAEALRRVYGAGFFLIGLHATEEQREQYLQGARGMTRNEAHLLMDRDRSEADPLGQQTRDTFTLADVFVVSGREQNQLARFLDMVFGDPHSTPTRDEHAMFLAYGASLRSGQLARQVGAVIVSADGEVIATGANDVPCFGGGQYWADHGDADHRDHKQGHDANDREIAKIIDDIVVRARDSNRPFDEATFRALLEEVAVGDPIVDEIVQRARQASEGLDEAKFRDLLDKSPIKDVTEFGRPVHAEMEALLACARTAVSTKGGTLYTTTFPCHNCAKHIVAAGIIRLVYVEPYPKSKALDLHPDSIALDKPESKDRVQCVPFVGIAARRYFDLFSMRLGDGLERKRKNPDGSVMSWQRTGAKPRIRMSPYSYLERETLVTVDFDRTVEKIQQAVQAAAPAPAGPEESPPR